MTNSMLAKKKTRVMLIDDDDHTRMIAAEFLSQFGFEVKEASNGPEALETIDGIKPDLILLDVEMPGMNGFEVCEKLRERNAYALTPILMLTGLQNDQTIDRSYDAGATDFATKPINWSLLSHRLKYMYRTSLAAAQLIREQHSLASAQRIAQLGSWQFDYVTGATEWSDQLYRILNVEKGSVKPTPSLMLSFVSPEDLERVQKWFKSAYLNNCSESIDHKLTLRDGTVLNVKQQVEREVDANGNAVCLRAIVQDFTEKRRVENKVHQLAYYDTLTNLPNRVLFQERLEISMKEAKRDSNQLGILYFDLDDFKRINDTFGHHVGDKLLQEVGQRLGGCLRTPNNERDNVFGENTIARMGGDEFTIVLSNIKDASHAELVAQRIIDVISKPFEIDGYELFTSPSIGVAIYPQHGADGDTLLKNADMAMYEAKSAGKNVFRLHDSDMDEKAKRQYNIDAQLRTALAREEFTINYQPQVDLNTGKASSVEALLRWNNASLEFVSPVEFIPVAEDNGLIVPIGEWVLRTACEQAKKWIDDDFAIQRIAVNVSALQFMRPDFPRVVQKTLDETGLPAENLELEITETLLASDMKHAVSTLEKLNDIGVELSIDDFGTGYSSLSQLKNFPIDRLKIDQSFIRNITENDDDAAITCAVIAMSKKIGIKVLAEGVETQEHFQFLSDNNCDEVQGYYVSKPMIAADIEKNMPEITSILDDFFAQQQTAEFKKAS